MSHIHAISHDTSRPWFHRLATALLRGLHLHQSRQRLSQLEPHLLADIGLTPEQARAEAIRPVWDAPSGWLNRE